MARRTAKKKTDKNAKPADADTPKTDGQELFAGFEQQCVALRTWHENASAVLEAREAGLDNLANELSQQQDELTESRQQLDADLAKLEDSRAALAIERETLAEMRSDLEAEWSALRDLRDAQAKLGHELDTERQRLNRRAFKMTNAPGSTPGTTPATAPKLKAA
ncbi:MAG: hypothetical protein AAGH99_04745 [Planctomycetota bacterium]